MKVDVIVPSYHGTYLEETLDSCFNQSYSNYEVTVVDNCSPNDIHSICKNFPRANYIRSASNNGPAGARNIGIENTNSPLISFIDDDDIMCPDKLKLSVPKFADPDVGLTCGNYRILVYGRVRKPFYSRPIKVNYDSLMRVNLVASGSTTARRSKFPGFDERFWIAEDYNAWLQVSENYKIEYIHDVLYHYRIIPGGNSITQSAERQKKHLSNLEIIKKESKARMVI